VGALAAERRAHAREERDRRRRDELLARDEEAHRREHLVGDQGPDAVGRDAVGAQPEVAVPAALLEEMLDRLRSAVLPPSPTNGALR